MLNICDMRYPYIMGVAKHIKTTPKDEQITTELNMCICIEFIYIYIEYM